jgi:hypothetical protein
MFEKKRRIFKETKIRQKSQDYQGYLWKFQHIIPRRRYRLGD